MNAPFRGIDKLNEVYFIGIGGIGMSAIIVHKELLIPIFCGVFFVETISVMLQVGYFKYTKKKIWNWKKNVFKGATSSSLPGKRIS